MDGTEIAVIAASWHLNDKITFAGLTPEFIREPAKAWRNYGSRVSFSLETALKDPEALDRVLNHARSDPYRPETQMFEPWFRGRPLTKYFLHLDLAKNKDGAGVALVHQEARLDEAGRPVTRDGKTVWRNVVDLVHREVAPFSKEIDFKWLREKFVFELVARGFNIALVTTDQWNSVEFQQQVRARGIETDLESADRTPAPYDTLLGSINDGSLDIHVHPVFMKEIRELRRINGVKYDHPKTGSKDAADAVACALYRCIQHHIDSPPISAAVISVHRSPVVARPYGD